MKKLAILSKGRLIKSQLLILLLGIFFSTSLIASENTLFNLEVNLTPFDAECGNNANDGAVTSIVSGGVPPYTYLWSNGETTQGIVNLAPGDYSLTVTDAVNNTASSTATVGQANSDIVLQLNASYETCDGSCDGNVSVNASGGTGIFTYLWNTGETFVVEDDACAGIYTVTVTDSDGCTAEGSIELELSPEGIWLMTTSTDATCASSNDGTAYVGIMTGVAPYTVEWSDGQEGTSIDGLAPGTYYVTVTDANGCFNIDSVSIDAGPGNIDLQLNASFETCDGSCDGNVSVNASGGVEPYTYLWNTGDTFVVVDSACAGIYTVTVTDANGCFAEGSIELELSPEGVWIMLSGTDVTCNGGNDGTAHASVMNGTPPYVIEWSNGVFGEDIVDLTAGVYTVTATDANGCSNSEQITINEPPAIEITVNYTEDADCDEDNGLINLGVIGGTAPYTYEWSNGETTQDIDSLPAGSYSVTVTDSIGCTATEGPIVIDVENPITIDIVSTTNAICGDDVGAIDIEVSGGTEPYSYEWSNGETTQDIDSLPAGSYSVTVTEAGGCTAVAGPIEITASDPIDINIVSTTNAICGEDIGAIDIEVTGGTEPYSYEWSNGEVTQDIDSLPAGNYSVTVTDAEGCTAIAGPIEITAPSLIDINAISITHALCGEDIGAIDIEVTGGTEPYEYEWSNGAMTQDVENLPAGLYIVVVTDANGCTGEQGPFPVESSPAVSITVDNVEDSECDADNGSIAITVSGGTPGFSYEWSNGAMSEDLDNLAPGDYSVTVTDTLGCTATAGPITVNEEDCCIDPPIIASVVIIEATCNNSDGTAVIDMVGNNDDYSYTWTPNVSSTNSASDLPAGEYSVVISSLIDPTCPSITEVFTIGNSDFPEVNVVASTPATCGQSNGSVEMSEPGFEYLWCNGATGYNPTNLPAGVCVVQITDPATDCTDFQTVIIEETDLIDLTVIIDNNPDCGVANGTVTIGVSGGSGVYTYEWSNGATTATVDNLPSGLYSVTVADVDEPDCDEVATFVLTDNVPGVVITVVEPIITTCTGTNDATVEFDTLFDPGFAQPAVIEIIDADGDTVTNGMLAPGEYCIVIEDSNGCVAGSECFEVTEPAQIDLDLAIHNTCDPDPGIEVVEIIGGTPDYTFDWADLPGTDNPEDRPDLETGSYDLTVTDANGCTVAANDLMVIDTCACPPMIISSVVVVESSCGDSTGQATVNVVGAVTSNFAYEWSIGGNTPSVTNLPAGTYSVTITNLDQPECNIIEELSVGNIDGPESEHTTTPSLCNGATGTTVFENPDYTYTWSDPSIGVTGNIVNNLPAGTYFVTITDPNDPDCIDVQTIVVDEDPAFALSVNVNANPDCNDSNGSVTVIVDQPGNYSYSWGNSPTVDNLTAGAYSVTVTDIDGGCTAEIAFVLTDNVPNAQIAINAESFVSCPGESDGTIDYSIASSGGPYTVDIVDSNGDVQTNGELSPGTYCLVAMDINGCIAGGECVDVRSPGQIDVDVAVFDEDCGEPGEIQLVEVIGGTGDYEYQWSNPVTTTDSIATELGAGPYSFTVTDANGCFVTETVFVEPDLNAIQLVVSGDSTICGSPVVLSVLDGSETYQWVDENGMEISDTSFAIIDTVGMFYITVTNGDCVEMDSIMVTPDELTMEMTDITVCFGTSMLLNPGADPNLMYEWTPEAVFDDPTAPSPTITTNDSTEIIVMVSDSLRVCFDTTTFMYNVIDEVELAISSDGPIFCSDDEVPLTASGNGTTYTWYDDEALQNEIGNTPVIEESPGDYGEASTFYVVSDLNGCTDTTSITIANQGIVFEVIGESQACLGDTIFLIPEFPVAVDLTDAVYTWTGPGIMDPNAQEAMVIVEETGQTTYSLEIETNVCEADNALNLFVTDFSASDATADPPEILISETSQLNVNGGSDEWAYEWSEDISFTTDLDIPDPEVQPEETTDYVVTITDNIGCVDTRTVTVTVLTICEEPFIFFPNAFSPNNDGFNDELLLRGQGVTEVFFAIYNRWGEKIFESNDQSIGWDGTFKGKKLPPDVYGFYLRVRCGNGDEFYKQGNVTLFR